ncbi:MAG: hypothetical protein ABI867_22675 [Kofleriaceae bacterium]
MLSGLPHFRSRKSMLETLLRRLDMVRLTIAAAAIFTMFGCSGLIDGGGNGGLTPAQAEARRLWLEKGLPALREATCTTCHTGSMAGVEFIAGASDLEIRDTLLAYEPVVVNFDAPGSSRLLTKGLHEGPALNGIQTSDLLEWLQAEQAALTDDGGPGTTLIQTEPILVSICTGGLPDEPAAPNPNCLVNTIPLDTVGDGVPGGKISFVVQSLSAGLYMTNIKATPGTGGIFIEHPLFVSYGDGAPRTDCDTTDEATGSVICADTLDRFFNVKMNLMEGAPIADTLVGNGAGAFVNFKQGDKISIHFKAVKLFQPDTMPPQTLGCKDLPAFKANAQAAFNALVGPSIGQTCVSCHGGANGNATATLNMTNMNSAVDAELLIACNNIRSRLSFPGFDTSSLLLAVDPANANHPVRFNAADHATFKTTRIKPWYDIELAGQ